MTDQWLSEVAEQAASKQPQSCSQLIGPNPWPNHLTEEEEDYELRPCGND